MIKIQVTSYLFKITHIFQLHFLLVEPYFFFFYDVYLSHSIFVGYLKVFTIRCCQCDQIGRFLKALGYEFCYKYSKCMTTFQATIKTFKKTRVAPFWAMNGNFCQLFIPKSGHTGVALIKAPTKTHLTQTILLLTSVARLLTNFSISTTMKMCQIA